MHTNLVITAVTYASIVYIITKIKKLESNIANAMIKYIAKKVAATKIGHFNIFCRTIESIIVEIGNAKNSNNISINFLL